MAKLLLTSTRAVLGTEIFLCTSKDSLRDRLLGTSLDRSRNDDNFLILDNAFTKSGVQSTGHQTFLTLMFLVQVNDLPKIHSFPLIRPQNEKFMQLEDPV